jgi:hypothetical protein
MAKRHNGVKVQRRKGTTAQRRNGTFAERRSPPGKGLGWVKEKVVNILTIRYTNDYKLPPAGLFKNSLKQRFPFLCDFLF